MASCDGEADSQRGWSLDVRATTIANSVNDEHENESDKSLDKNALGSRQRGRDCSDAQVSNLLVGCGSLEPENVD